MGKSSPLLPCGFGEGSQSAAIGHGDASPSWSDLPNDVLIIILQCLELPQAIAFASVCASWRSAAAAAGVPRSCEPLIMSWADIIERRERQEEGKCSSAATCSFRHLLDVNKSYTASFPQGCHFVACCGASHGWLVLVNGLANLVLYNPFTLAMIPLPPITDFACVKAVYGSGGNLQCYVFEGNKVRDANSIGTWFYQKAVLSCSPSKGADCLVMVIHRDGDWLSFVRASESKWQVVSTLIVSEEDRYADCVYHNGWFYTVTFHGIVEKWVLDGPTGPTKEVIVARSHHRFVLTRHLVSTPWGDLLQVRSSFAKCTEKYPDRVRFQIRMVDPDGRKDLSPKSSMALTQHAMFLGLNHSSCLPTKNFPRLRPCCIYFSAPWMITTFHLLRRCHGWGGVRNYDLEKKTFEHAFPLCRRKDNILPSEVWITPNV